jgi:hypothetical protein
VFVIHAKLASPHRTETKTSIFITMVLGYVVFMLAACTPGATEEIDIPLSEQIADVIAEKSTTIVLGNTKIDDHHAEMIAKVSAVETIRLGETSITDEGLASFAAMPNLTGLRLASKNITDDGLATLSGSKTLTFIILIDAKVTDAGLHYLHEMHQLESLYLIRTHVTDQGLALLQQKLPGLHIH